MLTRRDGTPVTIDNITDEDVALTRWNLLEHLESEEDITGFLEAVIEEGGAAQLPRALTKAAQARFINQFVKETGADRKALCDMFLGSRNDAAPANHDVVEKLARAFSVAVPV